MFLTTYSFLLLISEFMNGWMVCQWLVKDKCALTSSALPQ
uniref:Uncharacterized protein n=1 Tax=Arundo donax TaxID=35708 RepID=A0A0A9FVZ4_ARUDO